MSNKNDGRELEDLVALIEGVNLPPGFKIEKRRPVYDDDGVQIAELDILISGHVGTTPVQILIECRDRPSDGAAGADWIEQLVGRRQRFSFSKVVAVSTTGFSSPAVQFAQQEKIELRAIKELQADHVASWLPPAAPLIVDSVASTMPLAFVADYTDTEGCLHTVAKWEGNPSEPVKALVMIATPKK